MEQTAIKQIAIIIVAYRGMQYLHSCLGSLAKLENNGYEIKTFVVENGCPDRCCQGMDLLYPAICFIRSEFNRGFAGGNNFGWDEIELSGLKCDYLMLLNQDTRVESHSISKLASYLDEHPECGAAQALLLLDPETNLINTAGNQSHFLGFGFPTHYRERYEPGSIQSGEIGYASGAAVMIRCDLVRQVGLFAEEMFMYLEDADLSWKIRIIGYPPHLVADSVVWHQYEFNSSFEYLRYLEQNRWWLMLVYYKWRTLIIISPAMILMECGQLYFALTQGRLREKFKAIGYITSLAGIKSVKSHRRVIQNIRTIDDKELMSRMDGAIKSPHLNGLIVTKIASPLFESIWALMQKFIR